MIQGRKGIEAGAVPKSDNPDARSSERVGGKGGIAYGFVDKCMLVKNTRLHQLEPYGTYGKADG